MLEVRVDATMICIDPLAEASVPPASLPHTGPLTPYLSRKKAPSRVVPTHSSGMSRWTAPVSFDSFHV